MGRDMAASFPRGHGGLLEVEVEVEAWRGTTWRGHSGGGEEGKAEAHASF
jgi:hypothetical protein